MKIICIHIRSGKNYSLHAKFTNYCFKKGIGGIFPKLFKLISSLEI